LLTSAHVVRNSKDIRVNVGEVQYVGKVVKSDPANDVALVKLTSPQGGRVAKRVLPILNSGEVRLGDSVLTIGYPNPELQGIEPKLTRGEISSVAGIKDDVRFFQTSVAVQPGNSGGALVDVCGNVVGMVTMSLDEYNAYLKTGALPQNVNYALKSSFVLAFLDSVPELAGKLAPPKTEKGRPFEDLVKETQQATVIVLVY
jgi:S1-C subfamily serine protease